jgi:hypothetical protein
VFFVLQDAAPEDWDTDKDFPARADSGCFYEKRAWDSRRIRQGALGGLDSALPCLYKNVIALGSDH